MSETFRLGRVHGIRVGAHWSVIAIGWLLVWALADQTLPAEAPGQSGLAYWPVAVVVVALFWAGLLAHELAHSIVAIRHGVPVDGITLWLFGGVSWLHGDAASPEDELRIALAGPATSLAASALAGVLALAVAWLGGPDLMVAGLEWLALINGVLAAFNLVPAAPLDGGRVLHAFVWRRTGDRSRANVTATNAGRVFGFVLVGVGVVLVAAGNLGGVWFLFLGWFLLNAAKAEAVQAVLQDSLEGMRVRDVMTPDPVSVPGGTTVADLLDDWFMRRHCSGFPVMDHGRIVGMVTLRQIKDVHPDRRRTLHARDVAWPLESIPVGASDDPVMELLAAMARAPGGDGRALIFDHGALVGIVSPTDVSRAVERGRMRLHV
jgi:Zn-dependent protease/CBS domain-containing protein